MSATPITLLTTPTSMVEGSGVAVLPGDAVHLPNAATRPGPGVLLCGEGQDQRCVVSKAGLLRRKGEEAVWVHNHQKRYVPCEGERVLGLVVKTGRVHRVDIGAHMLAACPELAFEGATKRNKPNLQVGEVLYCRVTLAHCDAEPEVSCVDSAGRSQGLGPIRDGGFLFHCSLSLCRKLLSQSSVVLTALGKHYKYECIVGLNGCGWVTSPSLMTTIIIRNCILASEYMDNGSVETMVAQAAHF